MKACQLKLKISAQVRIKDNYWHCEFSAPQIAKIALPGQFIDIRVNDLCEPLLRRPISIHGVSRAKIKIFYAVVGKATEILARKRTGEYLDIIGPLGSGFALGKQKTVNSKQMLVAGGMGVAPLMFLAEKLTEGRKQRAENRITVLIGAKTKKQLLCADDFKKLGCIVKIATDDGSQGFHGKVTDLLHNLSSDFRSLPSAIYACGPKPMLQAVADISNQRGFPAQLSLEEHMSCGIGACLGCVVKTQAGFKRVCKEGPVFNSRDLVW
ncbi:MAG: dihydroorotate dehydrogenase electron transfer subunit [Candidatus Omnitrophota bacterium]|nr:dihydroorotate dehydrogenase electron transfer subunit [Candidatus Omnitrophota bacterium]